MVMSAVLGRDVNEGESSGAKVPMLADPLGWSLFVLAAGAAVATSGAQILKRTGPVTVDQ